MKNPKTERESGELNHETRENHEKKNHKHRDSESDPHT